MRNVAPTVVAAIFAFSLVAAGLTACSSTGGSVFDLGVGSCFNDDRSGLAGEVSSVPVVDCAAGHDNEVFAEFDLSDGPYPGDGAADSLATERCAQVFESYVGSSLATSSLAASHLRPTEDSWARGDREVTCFLFAVDLSKLIGSQRNSRA